MSPSRRRPAQAEADRPKYVQEAMDMPVADDVAYVLPAEAAGYKLALLVPQLCEHRDYRGGCHRPAQAVWSFPDGRRRAMCSSCLKAAAAT